MFHLLPILNYLPHVLRNSLLLHMLRKTSWQTCLPKIPCAPCCPLWFPVFLQRGEVKHLFLTSKVGVTLTRAASGPRHENPHEMLQSSLLPATGTEAAWIFPMAQSEGSDESGLLSDDTGLRPLTALQEHKWQKWNFYHVKPPSIAIASAA